ncbi:response regulator [Paenisporosarcina cavernae]|uniref:Transcriptional regulatory protein n=1 Tax=Paenisporosarcina cavernae TaxID=2320858 RepID=A0A385YTZ6_9BACL|nr:response regulator [Paenisporosarcina cavernae]AYC30146.1 response regulator [Paenisporosarcina cavernae]
MEEIIEIVIIEDDHRIADIHRRFIDRIDGFQVVGSAATGMEAKDWISALQPNLILLDVYLPDMLGTELLSYIHEESPESDIIFITAAAEVPIVKQAFRSGVFDYVVKPATFDRFKESLLSYKEKTQLLKSTESLEEASIQMLWNQQKSSLEADKVPTPKGIDPKTMEKVLFHLQDQSLGITAEKFGVLSGLSRSSSRRYLEFLVSDNKATAELIYGTIGRPERRYFPKLREQNEQNS